MVSLAKGANLSLSKEAPNLTMARVALGWDPRATDGTDFDLDASVFLLTSTGKVRTDADFIFYNQKIGENGAIEHTGDNRTGKGDGDDESIKVNLPKISSEIEKLVFVVTIDEAEKRRQNFGQVGGAFIRIVDDATGAEIVRYDLSEDYSTETALLFGELYRHNGEWKFRAVGQGYQGGLASVVKQYGVSIT